MTNLYFWANLVFLAYSIGEGPPRAEPQGATGDSEKGEGGIFMNTMRYSAQTTPTLPGILMIDYDIYIPTSNDYRNQE